MATLRDSTFKFELPIFSSPFSLSSPLLYPPPLPFLAHETRAPAAEELQLTSVGPTGPPARSTWHPAAIVIASTSRPAKCFFCFYSYLVLTDFIGQWWSCQPTSPGHGNASPMPPTATRRHHITQFPLPRDTIPSHPSPLAFPHRGMQVSATPHHTTLGHHATTVCKSCRLVRHTTKAHKSLVRILGTPCLTACCPHPHHPNGSEGRQLFALTFTGTHHFLYLYFLTDFLN
jgi:hypothetical protein